MARTKVPVKHGNSDDEAQPPTGQSPPSSRPRPKVQDKKATGPKKQPVKPNPTAKGKAKVDPPGKRPRSPSASPTLSLSQTSDSSETESSDFEAQLHRVVKTATTPAKVQKKPRTGTLPSPQAPASSQAPLAPTSSAPATAPAPAPALASAPPQAASNEEIPFLDGDLNAGVNLVEYSISFRDRPISKAVSVDLANLKNDLRVNLDLTDILGHYECLLKIREPYSPEVVRRFYANMRAYDLYDQQLSVTEVQMITSLRGRQIKLTKEILNEYLNAPPAQPEPSITVAEAQQILCQSDHPVPIVKEFAPSKMCDLYRIIHYIFSRSILNKVYSFTYLSQEDCVLLAKIIRGDKMDIGALIIHMLKKFTGKKYSNPIPFPQLASFILQKHKIAHLEGSGTKTIPAFGTIQINKMGIGLPFDHRRGRIPPSAQDKGKQKVEDSAEESPRPVPQKTVSAPTRPQASSDPSFLALTLQNMFKGEFEKFTEKITGVLQSVHSEVSEVKSSLQSLREDHMKMRHEVDDIKNLVLTYISNLGPTISPEDLDDSDQDVSAPAHELQPTIPLADPASSSEPSLPHPQPTLPSSLPPSPSLPDDKKGENQE